MAEDNRVDLDAVEDISTVGENLLKDVVTATKQAKERKAKDKARDLQIATQARDRTLMYVIVVVAAIVIFAFAYWLFFVRGSSADTNATTSPTIQTQPTPPPNYRTMPNSSYNQSAPVAPPSEPIRRTPTDTYDEGPGYGGM